MSKKPADKYFASLEDKTELLDALHDKIRAYYDYLAKSGIYSIWYRAYLAFYGGDLTTESSVFDSAKLGRAGKVGEITKVTINNYRNLVKYSLNIATSNKTSGV